MRGFYYKAVASALACSKVVGGHGGGMHYEIDGVVHKGNWEVWNNTEGSIQRLWSWEHNVVSLENPDMACGYTGTPSVRSYHAPIQAGNIVSVNYTVTGTAWEAINDEAGGIPLTFGHPYGPMLAYMAKCPEEGCEGVDINAPIWFKIWEAGLVSGTWRGGHWAMADVFYGANLDIPTPASLKPGKYLFRHEMINLQTGPVQWFPNCIQLDVSSAGNSLPTTDEMVSFPGAYDKDLGTSFTYRGSEWFYTEHGADTFYKMPGPAVWQG